MVLQQRHSKKEFSSGGIVYRNVSGKTEWLVVQHSQHKGWIFPKGLIGDTKDGETAKETAVREVEEEGGINAKIVLDKPFVTNYFYTFNGQKIFKTVSFYLMEYLSGDTNDHDWEVLDAKWLSTGDVRKTLTFPADKQLFAKAVIALNKIRQKAPVA
ncbi:MAG: NUDIX domain-containing protein [Patescibacteria group bacterium]|nr:NUDIX domain-containing protein [Patescibacteria group bacterium]